MVKLVCGCGYLGERVAHRWVAAGNEVWATTRSAERAAQLAGHGIRPIVVDLVRPFQFPGEMTNIDTVLWPLGSIDRLVRPFTTCISAGCGMCSRPCRLLCNDSSI